MLQKNTQNNSIFVLSESNPNKAVDALKEFIQNSSSVEITVDISQINLIDASRISVLCSTEYYLQNPNGKINWLIASPFVSDMSSSMSLGNSNFLCE